MRYSKFLQIFFIVVLCLTTYASSVRNDFIWDDDSYVYANPYIQKTEGLSAIWLTHRLPQYYPITFTTFWIEHQLWGDHPLGYHISNLIFHILNAILIFWVVEKLCATLAFPVALLFAVHPIQVETVAWVTERKNLLALFFFLLAMLSYFRFDATRKTAYYFQTLGLFVCALLSKSIAVCFVFIPVLYGWWRNGKVTWREIRLSLPLVTIGALSAINTIYLELYRVGARGDAWDLTLFERIVLAGRVLLFYLYKVCVPLTFSFFYSRWAIDASKWWQWLFPLVPIVILILLFYFRHQIGRGPLALFLFYTISIFPALGFFNVYPMKYSFVADHFSYLSTPVLILLICLCISFLLVKLKLKFPSLTSKTAKIFMWLIFLGVITYMSGKSMTLTRNYKDVVTLWENLLSDNPKAWVAYTNLGYIYRSVGKIENAISLYRKAIEIIPDDPNAYYNLANTYYDIGETEQAIELYRKTIKIDSHYVNAYNNLGLIYNNIGKTNEAIDLFRRAIQINPRQAKTYYNLGLTYENIGSSEEAIELYEKAIEIDLHFSEAYYNLGNLYNKIAMPMEAVTLYKKAIELLPTDPHLYFNLGNTYNTVGQVENATNSYKKAIEIDPHFSEAYYNLGNLYNKIAMPRKAIILYKRAIELLPTDPHLYFNLGNTYSSIGKLEDAVKFYKRTIALNPSYAEAYYNLALSYYYTRQYKLAVHYADKALELGFGDPALTELLKPYRGNEVDR